MFFWGGGKWYRSVYVLYLFNGCQCQSQMLVRLTGFVQKPLRMADLWQQAALDAKEIMEPMESTEAEARGVGIPANGWLSYQHDTFNAYPLSIWMVKHMAFFPKSTQIT